MTHCGRSVVVVRCVRGVVTWIDARRREASGPRPAHSFKAHSVGKSDNFYSLPCSQRELRTTPWRLGIVQRRDPCIVRPLCMRKDAPLAKCTEPRNGPNRMTATRA